MASIFKRKQSPVFYAAFKGADGKRVYRSTGTKVKREAQAIAVGWEKEEDKLRKSYSSKHRVVAEIAVFATFSKLLEKKRISASRLITTEDLEEVKAWLAIQKARGGRTVEKSTQNHKLGHLRGAF
ncbi:hypothetical protein [Roseibacillus persicicus]|uniref:hypothetical protein n=1 Tax=Roseibacillus persicicus TaxID=454148 RepID=UPI00280EF5B2|nr:hypothetical protein [Roseibacillus persicicus]MDQ8192359.1 hypothetical protein [Roseibacillus persicicus]